MSKEEVKTLAIYAITNGNKYCSTKCEWWYARSGGICKLFKIALEKEKDGKQRIKRCKECKTSELNEEDFGYSR